MNELRMKIKMMIASYKEALDHNQAMFTEEENDLRARTDNLAKEIYPEFDAEFYHHYADNEDWPDDDDDEEFFDDCRTAYRRAVDNLDYVGMKISDIMDRYNKARREIIQNRDDDVIRAYKSIPDDFWIGDSWEKEFKSLYNRAIYNG